MKFTYLVLVYLFFPNVILLAVDVTVADSLAHLEIEERCEIYFQKIEENLHKSPDIARSILSEVNRDCKNKEYTYGLASVFYYKGLLDLNINDYAGSMELFFKALKIFELHNDSLNVAKVINQIGRVYLGQDAPAQARQYFEKALEINIGLNNKIGIASNYNNLGAVYEYLFMIDEALLNYEEALNLYEDLGNKAGIAATLNNIGVLYSYTGNFKEELESYLKAYNLLNEINDRNGCINTLNNIANAYFSTGDLDKAQNYADLSYTKSDSIGYKKGEKEALLLQSYIANEMGDYLKALQLYMSQAALKDSIVSEESVKRTAELSAKYETEKKDLTIENLNNEKVLQQKELKYQNSMKTVFASGLVIMIFIALMIYRGYKRKQRDNRIIADQKEKVEIQKEEILESITYAKGLQTAILPPDQYFKGNLPDSFVLFKPKDIVSGDFYWMEEVNNKVLFAVADCTGHGVPGAMVSMVCVNALNKCVRELKIIEPAKILNTTRALVIETFEKSNSEVKDGMDISLCLLDKETLVLQWAGANNPLYHIKEIDKELSDKEISNDTHYLSVKAGDRQPIGKYTKNEPFTNHVIKLNKGDTIFLASDGFADQFGGKKGKKLKYAAFKELLLENSARSMEEQSLLLEQYLRHWMGFTDPMTGEHFNQVDDITLIGVKL